MLIFMTLSGYKNIKYVFHLIEIIHLNIMNYEKIKKCYEFSDTSIQKST